MVNDMTLRENIANFRNSINLITGEQNRFCEITDEMIWNWAQADMKANMRKQIIARDEYIKILKQGLSYQFREEYEKAIEDADKKPEV
jgi:hypothetical protein